MTIKNIDEAILVIPKGTVLSFSMDNLEDNRITTKKLTRVRKYSIYPTPYGEYVFWQGKHEGKRAVKYCQKIYVYFEGPLI